MNPLPPNPPPPDPLEHDEEHEAFIRRTDPVDLAAADWHTRWEQGLDEAEAHELAQWLDADPAHARRFARLHAGLQDVRHITSQHREVSKAAATPVARHSTRRRARWRGGFPRPAVLALCAVLLLAGRAAWLQLPSFDQGYTAARGQQLEVALPDGSALNLDAQTRARVSLYADRREVHLSEGQAMFQVAPDPDRPFHVLAGAARITVLGTRFSVRYQPDAQGIGRVTVAVEEGRVHVAGQIPNGGAERDGATDLLAGQGVAVGADGRVDAVATVSAAAIAPWRQGMLRFEHTPLAEALAEMGRYGPTTLVVRDPAVGAMPIGGSYRIGRVDEFARVLPSILPVQLVARPDGITEIIRAPQP